MSLLESLRLRADLYHKIRLFFAQRNVLEVETPLVSRHPSMESQIEPIRSERRFLVTSPEYHMKRLLAEGSGSIFQICKVFRSSELGAKHNPEFSMLEYYRTGFDDSMLRGELSELLQTCLDWPEAEEIRYQDLFLRELDLDPLQIEQESFLKILANKTITPPSLDGEETRDFFLDFLMAVLIEPNLGKERPLFITDYPASQASLARLDKQDPRFAKRFELYYRGMELANGFFELTDEQEQRRRFDEVNQTRSARGLDPWPLDEDFLKALKYMPECAGVAVGLDRILMIELGVEEIEKALSFGWERA